MNGIMGLHHPLLQALGFAVLHSVWQGALLFFILKMTLAFVPQRNAVVRYRLGYGALSVLFFLFIYTFFAGWQQAAAGSVQQQLQARTGAAATGLQWLSSIHLSAYGRYIPLLALMYTFGLIVLCSKMTGELLQVRYLRKQVMLPEIPLSERFSFLKSKSGIRRNVLLRLSDKVQVPVMIGFLKPLVLLPVSLVSRLDMQQTEAILLHELAHIRRNDYLWNMLQMVAETLLFFNPVVWWLSGMIREEREHCCDDYVLLQTGKSIPYAQALLTLEEYRLTGNYAHALSAAGAKNTSLLNRIKRFTTMTQQKKNTQRTLAAVTAVVLLGAMICFASAFGQGKKEEGPKQKTYTRSYKKSVVSVTDDKGHTKTYTKVDGDTSDMNDAMAAVPQALQMAGDAMKDIDWNEIRKTVSEAGSQASQAMAAVDWNEVHSSVQQALKDVDWNDVHKSVNEAMKEAQQAMNEVHMEDYMATARKEMAEAMKEMELEMKNVSKEDMRRSMDELKEDMKQMKEDMKRAAKESKESMKEDMKRQQQDAKRAAQDAKDNAGDQDAGNQVD